MSHTGSSTSNTENFDNSTKSSENEDADKKARKAQLEKDIAAQKSLLLGLRKTLESYTNNTDPLNSSPVNNNFHCIDAMEELYKLAGMHCVKSDANRLVYQCLVGSKVTKEDLYVVEILKVNGQYRLGRWVMPWSMNLRNMVQEYPITDSKALNSFLKRCKHHIDCYTSRRDQYCELKNLLSDTKNCELDTNLGNTLIILHMSDIKSIDSEKKYNVSVYMGYEANKARPYYIKPETSTNIISTHKFTEEDIYKFSKYFKPFMKHNLRDAFEKITNDTRFFQWIKKSKEDFEMKEFDITEFEEKNALKTNTAKKKSEKKTKHSRHNTSIDLEEQSETAISLPSEEEEEEEEIVVKQSKSGREVNSKETKQGISVETRRQSKIKAGEQMISKAEIRRTDSKKSFEVEETDMIDENKNVVEKQKTHQKLGGKEISSKDKYLKENSTEIKDVVAATLKKRLNRRQRKNLKQNESTKEINNSEERSNLQETENLGGEEILKERLNRRQRKKSDHNKTIEQLNNSQEKDNSEEAENLPEAENLKTRLNRRQKKKSEHNKTAEQLNNSQEKDNSEEAENLPEAENLKTRLNRRQRKKSDHNKTTEQLNNAQEQDNSEEIEDLAGKENLKKRLSARQRNKSASNKAIEVTKMSRQKNNFKETKDLAEAESSQERRLSRRQRKILEQSETTESINNSQENMNLKDSEDFLEELNLLERLSRRQSKILEQNETTESINNSQERNNSKDPEDFLEELNLLERLNRRQGKILEQSETTESINNSQENMNSKDTDNAVEEENLKKRLNRRERKKSVSKKAAETMKNLRERDNSKEAAVSNESEEVSLHYDGSEESNNSRRKNDYITEKKKSTLTRDMEKKLQNAAKPEDPVLITNSTNKLSDKTSTKTPRMTRKRNAGQLDSAAKRQQIARETRGTRDRSGQEDVENWMPNLLNDVATNDITPKKGTKNTQRSSSRKNSPDTSKTKSVRRPSVGKKGTANAISNKIMNSTPISGNNIQPNFEMSEISQILPSTSNEKSKENLTITEDSSPKKKVVKQKSRASFWSEDDPDEDFESAREVLKDIEEFLTETAATGKSKKVIKNVWNNTGKKKKNSKSKLV